MVRRYVPKNRRRLTPRQRDNRMRRAVELRAAGLSLRQIADKLAVDEKTVRNDLRQSEAGRGNVTPLRNSAAEFRPHGGNFPHPNSAPDAEIVPFRRSS